MQRSTARILTTHVGSLPRPPDVVTFLFAQDGGEAYDQAAFDAALQRSVADVVKRQADAGIDVVSDGEMSKPSYTTYIRHRVSGIEPDPRAAAKGRDIMVGRDLLAHPDFARRRSGLGLRAPARVRDESRRHAFRCP